MSLLIDYDSLIPRVSLYQFMSAHKVPASVCDHEGVHVRLTDALSNEISVDSAIRMSDHACQILIRRHTWLHRVKKCAQIIASLNNS